MNTATFAKLNDGSWGLRIQGDASEGDTVLTVRKDGTKSIKTVGAILFKRDGLTLARIQEGGSRPAPNSTYARRRRPCGYPGCTGYGHCDECS